MKTFLRYFYEILNQFFSGFISIFNGIVDGLGKIFNFKSYIKIAKNYKGDFNISEWVLFGISATILLVLIGLFLPLNIQDKIFLFQFQFFSFLHHII